MSDTALNPSTPGTTPNAAPNDTPAAGTMRPAVRNGWRKFAREWIIPLVIVAAVVAPFRSAIADWNDVPTGSMEPTILPGDRLFVNKLAYGLRVPFTKKWFTTWGGPDAGEVVILFSPADGQRLVKRVVARPGDTVELRDNRLFVNGTALRYERASAGAAVNRLWTESLGTHDHAVMETPSNSSARRSFDAITVPTGQYYVMGDNRDNSADSRYFGFVPRRNIVGRATAVALSVDPGNSYKPRWGRFFTKLP